MKKMLRKTALLFSVIMLLGLFTFMCSAENFELDSASGVLAVAEEPKIEITHEGMIYLVKGKTSKVTATVTGVEIQPQIIWTSSDEAIATVDEKGNLKGVNAGKVDIIATAEVGGKTISAKYPVKVVENENALNSYLEQHNILSFQYDYDNNCYYANDKKSWQKDFGFMMENYGHDGVTSPDGIGIGEFTIYDWGNGAASEAYNRLVDRYGKEEILWR